MREDLGENGLVHEEPAGPENPRDLAERRLRSGHVVARAKVEDDVERLVVERQVADICGNEARGERLLPQVTLRSAQQAGVDVHSRDLFRGEEAGEGLEADASAAP